ncbi:unnamed protein product [Larinioides sclopetarius]|uniref:Uncharacterized protein n=1 Tax=Larinioides sclopetarius TaxID=280406 RepID=A0AAV1ZU94_9ARAC
MTLFRPSFSVMVILATAMLFLMPYAVAQDDDDESPLQKLLEPGGLLDGVIGDNGILSGLLRDGGLPDIPLER